MNENSIKGDPEKLKTTKNGWNLFNLNYYYGR